MKRSQQAKQIIENADVIYFLELILSGQISIVEQNTIISSLIGDEASIAMFSLDFVTLGLKTQELANFW